MEKSHGGFMDRRGSTPIDQRVIDLYDDFTHRHLDRRLFMQRLTTLVGAAAAATLAPLLRSNYALAAQVPANDPRLAAGSVAFPGASGEIKAYLARPTGTARLPGVIVIHQNRGLSPHIEDVARRVALTGYVAVAPDCLSALGGTPADEDAAMALFPKLQSPVALTELLKTIDYLRARPDVTAKIGVVGFCWGGTMSNLVATASPALAAVVAYYGVAPPLDDVPDIKAALMLHYAGLDDRVNATRPAYEEALKKARVSYTAYVYDGANHAFNDYTNAARYNEAAAKLAWQRTTAFFDAKLKT
jgi:carboxymethylenebutenolidase